MRQSELAEAFFNGAANGEASNVQLQQLAGGTALVGYGHAVYAFRYPSGHVVYFHGWQGYSTATNSQLGKMNFTEGGDSVDVPTERSGELMSAEKFHVSNADPSVSTLETWLDEYSEPWL